MGEIFQYFLGQSFVFCEMSDRNSFYYCGGKVEPRMIAFKYFLDVRNFLFWVLSFKIFSLDGNGPADSKDHK